MPPSQASTGSPEAGSNACMARRELSASFIRQQPGDRPPLVHHDNSSVARRPKIGGGVSANCDGEFVFAERQIPPTRSTGVLAHLVCKRPPVCVGVVGGISCEGSRSSASGRDRQLAGARSQASMSAVTGASVGVGAAAARFPTKGGGAGGEHHES